MSDAWLMVARLAHDKAVLPAVGRRLSGLCLCVNECAPAPSIRWEMGKQLYEVYGRDVPAKQYMSVRGFWWGLPGSNERNDNARVLAALFLREMALDDERRENRGARHVR